MIDRSQLRAVAGTMTDREAAVLLGCHPSTVQRYRARRGMGYRAGRPSKLCGEIVQLLGRMPDRTIAAQYEVDPQTVSMWRRQHGVPMYRPVRRRAA